MRNKIINFLITLMLCLYCLDTRAQILSVPEIIQEQNQWCWAAVSKCILDCYGSSAEQCEIAEYTRNVATFNNFGLINCCVDPNQGCNYWNYNWGASGSIEDILYNFEGLTTSNFNNALSPNEWQVEISHNKPFTIRIGWNGGGGHFVIGYGISGSNYYTMDPWFNEGFTMSTYNWILTGQGGSGNWTHSQILSYAPVIGCTDSLACNYDVLSTMDDGSCKYDTYSYDTLSVSNSFLWNNITLNTSGDYSIILVNSSGCDSVVNLNLTITNVSDVSNIHNTKKYYLKILDFLARETKGKKNQPLFYIYDDGTVEKRITID